MSLVKTSLLNGISVVVKLATSLILNKVLAVQLGPTGYAVIGQFQNLISMVGAIASGAVNTGVTKYTAEYHSDTERRHAVWRTAAMISCAGGLVIACGLFFARVPIARWAFADESLSGVIVWLAAALLAILLNALLLAILSGIKAVRAFVIANILGSLISAAAATLLVTLFGLYGALVALATSQAVACVATLWLFHAQTETSWQAFIGPFDRTVAAKLGGFALMSISSALLVPIGQLIIREGLVEQIGWRDAGLWQALGRISETHLLLLTTTPTRITDACDALLAPLAPEKRLTGDLTEIFGIDIVASTSPDATASPQASTPEARDAVVASVLPEVTREYLRTVGVPTHFIDAWLREGVLRRTHRHGIYERTPEADRRIAALMPGDDGDGPPGPSGPTGSEP